MGYLLRHKYIIAGFIFGAIAGVLYWHFVGCNAEGGCPITSVWHNSAAYGAVMGVALGNLVKDVKKKK